MRTALSAILLLLALAAGATPEAKDDGVSKVKKERQDAHRKASETAGRLESNKQETAKSLRELNVITLDISEHERNISQLERQTGECEVRIASMTDSIRLSEKRIATLRQNYGMAVRKMHSRLTGFDQIVFIFSSSSVGEAYRRMRYLRQFSKWRQKQTAEIDNELTRLKRRRGDLEQLKYDQITRTLELGEAKSGLEVKQKEQNELVASLKKKGNELQKLLDEQNRKAEALDRELDRVIALEEQKERERQEAEAKKRKEEEERLAKEREKRLADSARNAAGQSTTPQADAPPQPKPASKPQPKNKPAIDETKLASLFEQNKGKLQYPVAGSCRVVRPFGRQRHPELKHVMTDNGGIDIDAPKGATARAVFDGRVSAVFRQDGYDMVVMIRHGKYLTIYVNLSEIWVSVGQTIQAGQGVGKISTDAATGDRALLHFEIRNERQKLNPAEWLEPKK